MSQQATNTQTLAQQKTVKQLAQELCDDNSQLEPLLDRIGTHRDLEQAQELTDDEWIEAATEIADIVHDIRQRMREALQREYDTNWAGQDVVAGESR